MDCFHDFCLACDKASVNGPYCSQACRLMDLEKAGADMSPPTSPRSHSHHQTSHWSTSPGRSYNLAPSYNFSQQDKHSQQAQSVSDLSSSGRVLSPSSSRTSLSSTSSATTSPGGLSEQARAELHGYFSSFDQARAARRRSSLR